MTRSQISHTEYNDYYDRYLSMHAPQTELNSVLEKSSKESISFINNISAPMDYRYQDNKWSIGEVIMHNIDTERVFAYRALRFMRGDMTELPGFDQDLFAVDYKDHAFAKADLIKSFIATRNATIALFENATDEQLCRIGSASGSPMSVRVIPFLIAGHCKHHENVIKERYLN